MTHNNKDCRAIKMPRLSNRRLQSCQMSNRRLASCQMPRLSNVKPKVGNTDSNNVLVTTTINAKRLKNMINNTTYE